MRIPLIGRGFIAIDPSSVVVVLIGRQRAAAARKRQWINGAGASANSAVSAHCVSASPSVEGAQSMQCGRRLWRPTGHMPQAHNGWSGWFRSPDKFREKGGEIRPQLVWTQVAYLTSIQYS